MDQFAHAPVIDSAVRKPEELQFGGGDKITQFSHAQATEQRVPVQFQDFEAPFQEAELFERLRLKGGASCA